MAGVGCGRNLPTTVNPEVAGSSPVEPAIRIKWFTGELRFAFSLPEIFDGSDVTQADFAVITSPLANLEIAVARSRTGWAASTSS